MSYRDRLSTNLGKQIESHLEWPVLDIINREPIIDDKWCEYIKICIETKNIKILRYLSSTPGRALTWLIGMAMNRKSIKFMNWYIYYYTATITHADPKDVLQYIDEIRCLRCRIINVWKHKTCSGAECMQCSICHADVLVTEFYELWKIYAKINGLVPTFTEALEDLIDEKK